MLCQYFKSRQWWRKKTEPVKKPAVEDSPGNDFLDGEKTGDAPAKEVKKPVPDELPDAPKLGRTESEDNLLEDPAP